MKKYRVVKWHNFTSWLYKHKMKLLSTFFYHIMQVIFSCSIPPKVQFDKGVRIPHPHGIVIHQDTTIGSGTTIFQNVTIGGGNKGYGATIGQNCLIGAGSVILGKVVIGNNVKIGANAVVLDDVPDGCTVVGVPAKIVKIKKEINN